MYGMRTKEKDLFLIFRISVLIIVAIVLMLASTALWIHLQLSASAVATNAHTQQTPVSQQYQDAVSARNIAQEYMNALLTRHYRVMWSILHPQVRARWPSEDAFVAYWKTRFEDYTLQSFKIGKARSLSFWVNPETMVQYNAVIAFPVSLSLVPKATGQQLAQLPPEDQHPGQVFQNLPFVMQRVVNQANSKAQWYVLAGGPADLEAPILPPLTPVTTSVQVPILMYHHISDIPPQNVLDWSLTVTPTRFSRQLDYLKQQGYHSITFNQMFDALYYNAPLPSRPIILTFDDGYEDGYRFAYPILRQHGFSGMFYIITGKVNWQGQMTWAQLHEMVAHGMQMGSHTIHHVDMGQVLLNSLEQAQQELQISKITLEQNLGIVVQQFCYPAGEPFRRGSWYARQQIVLFLAQDGYVGATTDPGITGIEQQSQEPFILLRIRVDGRESLQEFVSSLPW
jgi:peptidoglycan/xylan/chitin deacetylase (PgdA/CDA1 family)